ncbi:putative nuclease HARBI1 [Haliotis rubra]|uniref:putative nuclease HARBI1 n=1 Tax=Haliotis rubra TaxID=36100 RepID=UPI001EE56058|nr:putative nuclease HARBI1 [Haliotis rubra]
MALIIQPNAAFMVPLKNQGQEKVYRAYDLNILGYSDSELRRRYRFGRRSIEYLVDTLRDDLKRPTNRGHALTVEQQVLIALRFYASGSFLQVVGDTLGVDKSCVSRVVRDVTDALVARKDAYITWPTDAEHLRTIQSGFYQLGGFPNVIGCIDGTHVRIQAPTRDEPAYVNRKGYHSINVQAVCDHEGRLTNVCAKWPGAAHNSHLFRTSALCHHLEQHHTRIADGFILGDNGYPCRPFLLTPYFNPHGQPEQRYNDSLCATRVTIERTFGRWKRRFHVLHSEVRMEPSRVCCIVVACAVLHNIAIDMCEPDDDRANIDEQPPVEAYGGRHDGKGIRDHIARTFFAQ